MQSEDVISSDMHVRKEALGVSRGAESRQELACAVRVLAHDSDSALSDPGLGGRGRWKKGDVIGLACDLRDRPAVHHQLASTPEDTPVGGAIWVSLNGEWSPPYGRLFHLPPGLSGLHAALSGCYTSVQCCMDGGENGWRFSPPYPGFEPMSAFRLDGAGP